MYAFYRNEDLMENGRGFDTSEKSVRSLYTWKTYRIVLCAGSLFHILYAICLSQTVFLYMLSLRVYYQRKTSANRAVEIEVSAQERRLHEFCSNPMFAPANVEISMKYACLIYKRYAKGNLNHAQTRVSDFIAPCNRNAEENVVFAKCCEFQALVQLSSYLRCYKVN